MQARGDGDGAGDLRGFAPKKKKKKKKGPEFSNMRISIPGLRSSPP
jgi:hypothetical protein